MENLTPEYNLSYEQALAAAQRGCVLTNEEFPDLLYIFRQKHMHHWLEMWKAGLLSFCESEARWRIVHDPADYVQDVTETAIRAAVDFIKSYDPQPEC